MKLFHPPLTKLALFLLLPLGLQAGTVSSVRFRSPVIPPVAKIPEEVAKYERTLRTSLERLPEGALLIAALTSGSRDIGLGSTQVASLSKTLTLTYRAIATDPEMKVPSALPYCASTTKHSTGHYFLVQPDLITDRTPCMVFLHGDGGNFLVYPWLMKQEFPEAVILFPSWELSWEEGSRGYIDAMLEDAERRLGRKLSTPMLMGVSSGGSGGLRIYNEAPNRFTTFVSITAAPKTDLVTRLDRNLSVLMMHGTQDTILPISGIRRLTAYLSQRLKGFEAHEVEGGHFFLLTHRQEAFRVIKEFLKGLM